MMLNSTVRSESVAGAGFVAMDILLSDGQDSELQRRAGGTCGNVLAILSFLGFEATLIARLGTDRASDVVVSDLQAVGVNCRHIQRDHNARTPRVIEFLPDRPGESHRFAFKCPKCLRRFPRRSEPTYERSKESLSNINPSFFFFDRSGPVTIALAKEARDNGAIVMFEPDSLRNGKRFDEALQVSHIVKYSAERISQSIEPWLRQIDRKPRLIVETLDGGGLRYMIRPGARRQSHWNLQEPFFVKDPIDQAGAGDWCSAGLISRILSSSPDGRWRSRTIRRALAFGQALAAASILFAGPRGFLENYSRSAALRGASSTLRRGKIPDWLRKEAEVLGKTVGSCKSVGTGKPVEACVLCLVPVHQK